MIPADFPHLHQLSLLRLHDGLGWWLGRASALAEYGDYWQAGLMFSIGMAGVLGAGWHEETAR